MFEYRIAILYSLKISSIVFLGYYAILLINGAPSDYVIVKASTFWGGMWVWAAGVQFNKIGQVITYALVYFLSYSILVVFLSILYANDSPPSYGPMLISSFFIFLSLPITVFIIRKVFHIFMNRQSK